MSPLLRLTLSLQASYYLLTGIWPIVHLASFEAVTGPKTDDWLVRTVGAFAMVIGASLAVAARQRDTTPVTIVLAAGAALAFLTVDVAYVLVGRISPIYLADALAEAVLLAMLFVGRRQRSR
jgi:hypothetical protein